MAERDLEESKMILEFSDNGFFLTDRYFSGLFSHYLQEQLEIKQNIHVYTKIIAEK